MTLSKPNSNSAPFILLCISMLCMLLGGNVTGQLINQNYTNTPGRAFLGGFMNALPVAASNREVLKPILKEIFITYKVNPKNA